MATHSISGNVAGGASGDIVYLMPVGDYPVPSPFSYTLGGVTTAYSFTGLADGVYNLYAGDSPLSIVQVIVSGDDHANVNLSVPT